MVYVLGGKQCQRRHAMEWYEGERTRAQAQLGLQRGSPGCKTVRCVKRYSGNVVFTSLMRVSGIDPGMVRWRRTSRYLAPKHQAPSLGLGQIKRLTTLTPTTSRLAVSSVYTLTVNIASIICRCLAMLLMLGALSRQVRRKGSVSTGNRASTET